jgi:cytochrome P450
MSPIAISVDDEAMLIGRNCARLQREAGVHIDLIKEGLVSKVYRYGFDTPYRLEVTPLYAQLRSEEPIARVELPYGEEGWLVTRHASVKTVLADQRFSRTAVVAADDRTPRSSPLPLRSNPLTVDLPEHTRLRQPVATGLRRQPSELSGPEPNSSPTS